MAITNQDFTLYVGTEQPIVFTVEDAVTLENCTNIIWRMGYGSHPDTQILEVEMDDMDVDGNEFTVTLLDSQTSGLKPGTYYHEARVIDENDKPRVVTTGAVTVIDSLTV